MFYVRLNLLLETLQEEWTNKSVCIFTYSFTLAVSDPPRPYDFLIEGQFLRTSLAKYFSSSASTSSVCLEFFETTPYILNNIVFADSRKFSFRNIIIIDLFRKITALLACIFYSKLFFVNDATKIIYWDRYYMFNLI